MVEFAKNNSQAFRAHNLIWASPGTHNPDFVINQKNEKKQEEFMVDYITKTVKAIGDYPYAWDVVNEAVNDGPSQVMKDSPWSIVDDFMCKAFKAARDAAPKGVKLFYNDYKHASMTGIYQRKSDNIFNMIKNMTERGEECPIDGVGF